MVEATTGGFHQNGAGGTFDDGIETSAWMNTSMKGLTRDDRFELLRDSGVPPEAIARLQSGETLTPIDADAMIENVVGEYSLPIGVGFTRINGVDRVVPMVLEEPSVVAALTGTSKWIERHGGVVTADMPENLVVGQIQIPRVGDLDGTIRRISEEKDGLIAAANSGPAARMHARGGGVQDIEFDSRETPDGRYMGSANIVLDPSKAMGANTVTQTAEFLAPLIEGVTGETTGIKIVSNYSSRAVAHAEIHVPGVPPEQAQKIVYASEFAQLFPERATTHNKGIMNGITPTVIATCNDFRAVEASAHSYAARDGQTRGLSQWVLEDGELVGRMDIPLPLGTVGGAISRHPGAALSLEMLQVDHPTELGATLAATGLIQNLGALRGLTRDEGIMRGHMALHNGGGR